MRLSSYVANTDNVIGKSGKIYNISNNLHLNQRMF